MRKSILLFIIGVFLLTMVNAEGISETSLGSVAQNTCIEIPQTCGSCLYVNLTIYYPNKTRAITNEGMSNLGGGSWSYEFCNTSEIGRYYISGGGDVSGSLTGFDNYYFKVNEGGVEFNGARMGGSLFLIAILVVFLIGSMSMIYISDGYIQKFSFYWVSHILTILIFFSSWQVGVEGLFGSVGVTGIFRILFYLSIVSAIPMVFLSLAWIFYIHTFNEHFEKLIDKGMSTEDAFAMANKKSGGWKYGK